MDSFHRKCFYIIIFLFPLAFQRRIPNCSKAKNRDATTKTKHFVENSHWKFSLDSKSHRKKRTDAPEKSTRIFTSICRGTASHNVYLTENSPKLKTVNPQDKTSYTTKHPTDKISFGTQHPKINLCCSLHRVRILRNETSFVQCHSILETVLSELCIMTHNFFYFNLLKEYVNSGKVL